MDKVNYDDYFLTLCFLVAQRSIDPSTKCGAVLVSKDHKILSTGYNGPIGGSNDDMVPLTRPEKYAHMIHAEDNCLAAYSGSREELEHATIYVTGKPCHGCLRTIMQKGIRNVVYTNVNVAVMQDAKEQAICDLMLAYGPKMNIRVVDNVRNIADLLGNTIEYIKNKNPSKFS